MSHPNTMISRRPQGGRWNVPTTRREGRPLPFGRNQYYLVAMLFTAFAFWNMMRVPPSMLFVIDDPAVSGSKPVGGSSNAVRNDERQYHPNNNENNDTKYILYYTPFWNHKDHNFGFGQEPFQQKCSSGNKCFATDNRDHLPSMGDFDAVIFHYVDFHYPQQQVHSIKRWRKPHQRFVYFNVESPDTYPLQQDYEPGFFNWTLTYRHDSDVVRRYGWFQEKQQDGLTSGTPPLQTREWPIIYDEQAFRQQNLSTLLPLAKRPKKVAWIVSNCNTASRRDEYVRELNRYIPVDVFGKCGSKSCDVGYQAGKNRLDNCTLAVEQEYKFYLSFENSLCTDYVTEKFFSRISKSVVIIMGGANYSQVAPPHSYMNVMDYASPKELAEYLWELDRNDTKYLSYFWWKQHYESKFGEEMVQAQAFCDLCDKLHNPNEPSKSYASLQEWLGGQCSKIKVPGMPPAAPFMRAEFENER